MIATISPELAKETVLSKVINYIDGFRMDIGNGFDDVKRKHNDTVLKLDNSKTIMLETKGNDVLVKNQDGMKVKVGKPVTLDYSEYIETDKETLFISYAQLFSIPLGTKIRMGHEGPQLEIKKHTDAGLICEVIEAGTINFGDYVAFEGYDPVVPYMSEREKREVLRAMESGVSLIVASAVKSPDNMRELREFLRQHNFSNIKIVAKIERAKVTNQIDEILDLSDGIVVKAGYFDELGEKGHSEQEVLDMAQEKGRPVFLILDKETHKATPKYKKMIAHYVTLGIDAFMIDDDALQEYDPVEVVTTIYDMIHEESKKYVDPQNDYAFSRDEENSTIDYVLYLAYQSSRDVPIKAIVCYTNNGYTAARLSSFKPGLPVITFTKDDATYRYINLLRGVKAYKISQAFDYQNLKKIGKEMIRILFKGNISLDDKIVIVQSHEHRKDIDESTFNGLELYRFKNI